MTIPVKHVGIIGFGFIGKVHAYAYATLPYYYQPVPVQARITHVCASRPETAEAGRALVCAEHAVTDYRQITENPAVDIVHICTPNHLHKDALLSAMAHGKHIYCDKPLTATLAEAEEIATVLAAYRGTAQMTFQSRFVPATLRIRQLLDDGFLGKVLEFRASFLHAGSAGPDVPLKWKLSGAAGGGVIADLGSHVFDLLQHFLGDFDALLAATHIAYPERPADGQPGKKARVDAEDCAMILARMKNGALGNLEATKLATGTEDELRVEMHGSLGAIRYNSTDPHHFEMFDARQSDQPCGGNRGWTRVDAGQRYPAPALAFPGHKLHIGWLRAHIGCLAEFLYAVAAGRPGDPGLDQGIRVQRLMAAAQRSARRGNWERVDA
jgi:predicted dehydrogenase